MANLIDQSPSPALTYGNILNYWDAMKADKNATLMFPFGDEDMKTMTALLEAFGNKEIAKQPTKYWFEQNRQEALMTVDNGPVTKTSGLYTVQIPTTEVDTSTGFSWPAATDVWEHAVSGAKFYIQSKTNASTFVLKPLLASTNVTLGDNEKLFYVGQLSPERSSAPDPKYYFSTQYSVDLGIVRHSKDSSGSALFNQMWTTQTESGIQTPFSNSRDVTDLQRTHTVAMVNTFLTGVEADNLSVSESFGSYNGIDVSIVGRGQREDTGGNPDETNFYDLENLLSQQDASVRNYSVLMPGQVFRQIQTNMLDYLKQTNIATTTRELHDIFYGGDVSMETLRTTLDFQALTLNGKNFALTRLGILDRPTAFNSTAQATNPWQNKAIFIPVGQTSVNYGNGEEGVGKYVRLYHKPERFMRMTYSGMMADKNQTRVDELAIDIISEYAFAFPCINKFGEFYKA